MDELKEIDEIEVEKREGNRVTRNMKNIIDCRL
jgi:hypothetical protein